MKKITLALASLALLAVGCSSASTGDVPIVKTPTTAPSAANPAMTNPNVPQAARDAMAGKGK